MPFQKESIGILRTQAGMTNLELSQALGCTQQTIFNLEKGRNAPSIRLLDSLHAFCQKMNIDPKPVFYTEPHIEPTE